MSNAHLIADDVRELLQVSTLFEWLVAHPLIALISVFAVLAAYGCSEVAMRKNRNDRAWAALGALFSVLPLIVLLMLPPVAKAALPKRA